MIGPAFVGAYRLEQSVACYPRVILDEAAMKLWKEEFALPPAHADLKSLVKRDRDGQHFIDVFRREWSTNFIPWTEILPSAESIPIDHVDLLKLMSQQIQKGLADNIGRPKVHAKYEWLATEYSEYDVTGT